MNPKTPIPSFFITPDFTENPDRFPHRWKVKKLRTGDDSTRCSRAGWDKGKSLVVRSE
jgi:hypothetical protein